MLEELGWLEDIYRASRMEIKRRRNVVYSFTPLEHQASRSQLMQCFLNYPQELQPDPILVKVHEKPESTHWPMEKPQMTPPAMAAKHTNDGSGSSVLLPFAEFSPEW